MEDFFMRITPEEKLKYVKMHLEENVPIFELKRKYGIQFNLMLMFVYV